MNKTTKILLVEDEVDLRTIYYEVLLDAGYNVEAVADGDTALARMTQGGYDLVLLDVMLPQRDGLQIAEYLQQHPSTLPNKRIVFMTNLAEEATLAKGKKFGVNDLLVKTNLDPGEFLKQVKKYLGEDEPN